MEKFPAASACPVCSSKNWDLAGINATISVDVDDFAKGKPTPGTPMVLAVCQVCCFIRQFAWIPILQADNEAIE
jgi:hypothetical protein